jgi:hypothetical protein
VDEMNPIEDINNKIKDLERLRDEIIQNQVISKLEAVKQEARSRGTVEVKAFSYYVMTDADFDLLVEQEFGRECEIVAYEEWSNYTGHTINVGLHEFDENRAEKAKEWAQGGRWPGYFTFLVVMVKTGRLPAGNYLIKVYW